MALFSTRSWEDWVAEYERGHRHPKNRLCHSFGIPTVAASVALLPIAWFVPAARPIALVLFVVGWVFQFTGHAYEGTKPEFFKDWRFLFVGLRWWFMKVLGRGSARGPSPSASRQSSRSE